MKKAILYFLCAFGLMAPAIINAQTFTVQHDTVYQTYAPGNINDFITNISSSNIYIKWRVTDCDFAADWLVDSVFGICDNASCRFNSSDQLWNPTTRSGSVFTSATYAPSVVGDFHLSLDLTLASPGTHHVTINLIDGTGGLGAYSKQITFYITKASTGVPTISNGSNDLLIYPNPAHDELNVVYDPSADVKTIAVYNIIGKVMTVYKVSDPAGANLNIENIPSGIYFVRFMNSHGEAVVTRRFTKQ